MKPLESATTGMQSLADGRLELTIRHDIIKGVTPAMLGWWFRHIDATMEHMGRTYPRYLVWHPVDHIHFQVVRRAPDGTAGPGARFHLVEALGGTPDFLIDSVADVLRNDETGITIRVRQFGLQVMHLQHTFTPEPEGTLYQSRMHVGTAAALARLLINPLVRSRFFTEAMGRAWLKHNIEETGNFEFFLQALYRALAGPAGPG
jgi:hypothetical protein